MSQGHDRPHPIVGPNTILQVASVLRARGGEPEVRKVFATAGLTHYVDHPPDEMVPEGEAARLFAAVETSFEPGEAAGILRAAGLATGDYIVANRIPPPARRMLALLPRALSSRALLSAIGKHAWTFAGSGRVVLSRGRNLALTIIGNPIETAGCIWHVAVLERLFEALLGAETRVTFTPDVQNQEKACRFAIVVGKRLARRWPVQAPQKSGGELHV